MTLPNLRRVAGLHIASSDKRPCRPFACDSHHPQPVWLSYTQIFRKGNEVMTVGLRAGCWLKRVRKLPGLFRTTRV